jgi:hypothetical protein
MPSDQPFIFDPTGSQQWSYDSFANDQEIFGNNAIYNVTGFGGVTGNVTIPIDLSTETIAPVLTAKFGGVPIWVWFVAGAFGLAMLFKKNAG